MAEKRFKEQNLENHLNRIYDTTKGGVVFDEDIVDLLNTLHEENNNLKQALWEAETEYIHERYYDNPIRKEESINELKEDFKRGYWNG